MGVGLALGVGVRVDLTRVGVTISVGEEVGAARARVADTDAHAVRTNMHRVKQYANLKASPRGMR